jgi:hypothetical protein
LYLSIDLAEIYTEDLDPDTDNMLHLAQKDPPEFAKSQN